MQLKNRTQMNPWMSAAATTLLGAIPLQSQAAPAENEWEADAAVLYYGEIDRVTAIEPVIQLQRNWSAEQSLTGSFVFDALTGASHNGAAVVDSVQTFTSVSGGGYEDDDHEEDEDHESQPQVFQPGEVPLIGGYEEARYAIDVAYKAPFSNPQHTYTIGTTSSLESDYFSFGLNGALGWELNQRNTALTVGAGSSFDVIYPKGGMPIELRNYDADTARQHEGLDTKQVIDVSAGLTQIINKSVIAQFNYGIGWLIGYQNDPYKVVSILNDSNLPVRYVNEARPDYRLKQSLRLALKTAIGPHSATTDYRYYWDDWSVESHTLDEKLRFNVSNNWYLEAHGRWYIQSNADFYHLSWSSDAALPTNLSADYRLGNLYSQTYGVNLGFAVSERQDVSWRVELYNQRDPETTNKAADMTAIISQLNYSVGF